MDAGKIFLSAMLGGVKGGAEGYSGEADKQRDYALKQLEINKPPSEIQSLRSIYPDFDENQEAKETRALNYRAAGAGVDYKMPNALGGAPIKRPLNPQLAPEMTFAEKAALAKGKLKTYNDWLNGKTDLDGNVLVPPRTGAEPARPTREEVNLAVGSK